MTQQPLYIMATPRTGTTLICKLLNQTGLFDPELSEWFNSRPYMDKTPWPDDGTIPRNNKVFPYHLKDRYQKMTLDPILEVYPDVAFVEIYREDIAAQTASNFYSWKSNIWNTQDPARIAQYQGTVCSPTRAEAMHIMRNQWVGQLAIRDLLEDFDHLVYEYEDIAARPCEIANEILEYIGADYDPGFAYNLDMATKKLEHPGKDQLAAQLRKWQKEWEDAKGMSVATP